MKYLLNFSDLHGLPLYLSVDVDNSTAIEMYKRAGFLELRRKDTVVYMLRDCVNTPEQKNAPETDDTCV